MKKMVFFQEISNENKQEEVFFHSVEEEEFFFCQSWMSRDRNYFKKEIEREKDSEKKKEMNVTEKCN